MKACSKNRKPIAWLALDALDGREAAALRAHLEQCEGCRSYWESMSSVTGRLAAAKPDSNLEPSAFFHQRVSEKLRATEPSSIPEKLAAWLRGSVANWRVAMPATAALMMALLGVVAMRHHLASLRLVGNADAIVSDSGSKGEPAPTIANYKLAACQSQATLDEFLTRQGDQPLPRAPIFTASGPVMVNGAF